MCDDSSDLSSELSDAPSSPEIPPSFYLTPTPSRSDEKDGISSTHPIDDMPPARKRRKVESMKRTTRRLCLVNTFDDDDDEALDLLLKALRKRRKIVVIAGAGISVSAGIPDFRSSQGLFQTLKEEHKLKASGKQLFDASVYKNDSSTSSFHDMVRSLSDLSAKAKPTPFHRLLARLAKEDRLLRLYSQNVDGIELSLPPLTTQIPLNHKAPWPRTIQLHGGLEKMVCHKCGHLSDFKPELFQGPLPPLCQECVERDSVRTTHAGKRSHGVGRLRPRMVLYNEQNPDEDAIGTCVASDLRARPDAVIVVGTSLKIPPVRRIVKEMCLTARGRQNGITLMINKESLALGKDLEDCFDVVIEGESDMIAQLAHLKEWDDDSEDIIEECTASDVERAKERHRQIRVVIETPKKDKHWLSVVSHGIMTPPISVDEEIEVDHTVTESTTPTKNKFTNPASTGRSIADVLGQGNKENRQKKSKTKSMLKSVVKSNTSKKAPSIKRSASSSASQSKLTAKVTKSSQISVQVKKEEPNSKPLDPIPAKAHRINTIPMFPGLSRHQSSESIRSSSVSTSSSDAGIVVDTGAAAKSRTDRETISPSGRVPGDMIKLLN